MSLIEDWNLTRLLNQLGAIPQLQILQSCWQTWLQAPASSGDTQRWQQAYQHLIALTLNLAGNQINLHHPAVTISSASSLTTDQLTQLCTQLRAFIPWRKGPWQVFDQFIDCEWRSDLKWARLASHIQPLQNRLVLDVGCGNGYYAWRMLGAGAQAVIGVDPTPLFQWQAQVLRHWIISPQAELDRFLFLPVGLEHLPDALNAFDTVFSMGVLYHRRSPIEHLYQLKQALKPGGELVLETLIINGPAGMSLLPADRYAQMRNVWFIPSIATLEQWLARVGFTQIRCVDISTTSTEEQRSTEWMPFDSLSTFLDPKDASKTCEGYPAPKRAIVLANKS